MHSAPAAPPGQCEPQRDVNRYKARIGYGISRTVIQNEIKYHCGPNAIVRPYTYQGRDGFLVTTPGPPLTEAQIHDIKEASAKFEQEQAAKSPEPSERHFVNKPVQVNHHSEKRGQ